MNYNMGNLIQRLRYFFNPNMDYYTLNDLMYDDIYYDDLDTYDIHTSKSSYVNDKNIEIDSVDNSSDNSNTTDGDTNNSNYHI